MARIVHHKAGFEALLTSDFAKSKLKHHAERIEDGANAVASTTDPAATEPYYETVDATTDRARYRVQTALGEQLARNIRHEARTQALQKNI